MLTLIQFGVTRQDLVTTLPSPGKHFLERAAELARARYGTVQGLSSLVVRVSNSWKWNVLQAHQT